MATTKASVESDPLKKDRIFLVQWHKRPSTGPIPRVTGLEHVVVHGVYTTKQAEKELRTAAAARNAMLDFVINLD